MLVQDMTSPESKPYRSDDPADAHGWTYDEAFSRNLGLIGPAEQQRLRDARIAIPGMGGVGGVHLETLARLGIGQFSIADGDTFETANFNRQAGATIATIGQSKATVMARRAESINPDASIRVWNEPIDSGNVADFLEGVDVLVDSVDFWAFETRRLLYREARNRNIWVITAGPLGFSTAWIVFDPKGMTFEGYFDLNEVLSPVEEFAAFYVGLTPQMTQRPYIDLSYVDGSSGRGPSASPACFLCAGVVGVEVVKILLNRGVQAAPVYSQFDAYRGLLKRGKLRWGNRGPLQRFKRRLVEGQMMKLGYKG